MARQALLLAIGAMVLGAGCTPEIPEGRFSCGADTECPGGWYCVGGRCQRERGMTCRFDAECEDPNVCTADFCDGGSCQHEPTGDGEACDDGRFCNGRDACSSGECAPLGDGPPCPGCTEDARCPDCGGFFQPCCGMTCQPGLMCEAGSCVSCGNEAERCCPGDACNGFDLHCDGATCVTCGGELQPCCTGLGCEPPFVCADGMSCTLDAACAGCLPRETCLEGACTACGAADQPCCGFIGCEDGLFCFPDELGSGNNFCRIAPDDCGHEGEQCCGFGGCREGSTCALVPDPGGSGGFIEQCERCGELGELCCSSPPTVDPGGPLGADRAACDDGLVCSTSGMGELRCAPCGAPREPCCEAATACTEMPGGNACIDGYCAVECGEISEPCCPGDVCGAGICGTEPPRTCI